MDPENKLSDDENIANEKLKRVIDEMNNESETLKKLKKEMEPPNLNLSDFRDPLLADEHLSRAIAGPVIDRYMYPEVFRNEDISRAKLTYEILLKKIKNFELTLDNEHEIGAHLVSFGREFTFNIQYVGWADPDVLVFEGVTQENEKVQLIQNVAQLNVLFISMPNKSKNKPNRIWFLSEVDEN